MEEWDVEGNFCFHPTAFTLSELLYQVLFTFLIRLWNLLSLLSLISVSVELCLSLSLHGLLPCLSVYHISGGCY